MPSSKLLDLCQIFFYILDDSHIGGYYLVGVTKGMVPRKPEEVTNDSHIGGYYLVGVTKGMVPRKPEEVTNEIVVVSSRECTYIYHLHSFYNLCFYIIVMMQRFVFFLYEYFHFFMFVIEMSQSDYFKYSIVISSYLLRQRPRLIRVCIDHIMSYGLFVYGGVQIVDCADKYSEDMPASNFQPIRLLDQGC